MKTTYTFTVDQDAITDAYLKAIAAGLTSQDALNFLIHEVSKHADLNKLAAINRINDIFELLRQEGYDSALALAKQKAHSALGGIVSSDQVCYFN